MTEKLSNDENEVQSVSEKLSNDGNEAQSASEKSKVTLPGTVEKVIPPLYPGKPEKAQISVDGADHLYREIRVENTLQDASGKEVELKPGAEVDVTIEAEPSATVPKKPAGVIASDGNLRRKESAIDKA